MHHICSFLFDEGYYEDVVNEQVMKLGIKHEICAIIVLLFGQSHLNISWDISRTLQCRHMVIYNQTILFGAALQNVPPKREVLTSLHPYLYDGAVG